MASCDESLPVTYHSRHDTMVSHCNAFLRVSSEWVVMGGNCFGVPRQWIMYGGTEWRGGTASFDSTGWIVSWHGYGIAGWQNYGIVGEVWVRLVCGIMAVPQTWAWITLGMASRDCV